MNQQTKPSLSCGPCPYEEMPLQVGVDAEPAVTAECRIYLDQLLREHPIPQGLPAAYELQGAPHAFGTYYEVHLTFDDKHCGAVEFAYAVESSLPARWDQQATAARAAVACHEAPLMKAANVSGRS